MHIVFFLGHCLPCAWSGSSNSCCFGLSSLFLVHLLRVGSFSVVLTSFAMVAEDDGSDLDLVGVVAWAAVEARQAKKKADR